MRRDVVAIAAAIDQLSIADKLRFAAGCLDAVERREMEPRTARNTARRVAEKALLELALVSANAGD